MEGLVLVCWISLLGFAFVKLWAVTKGFLAPLFIFVVMVVPPAHAIFTEVGLSYNYKKITFDDNNDLESQGYTGSIAFYVWERVALEVAYTNSLLVKHELQLAVAGSTSKRTTTQSADIYEFNTQFLMTQDRKAMFQPFLKAGVAYISKKQQVQIDSNFPYEVRPTPGYGPSIGLGAKFFVTDQLSFRMSYDVVRTPIDNGATADDITGRAGISWLF